MEKALRNGLCDYKTIIYLAEFLTIFKLFVAMKATKRILENIAWDLPWIFRYVFQYIQPKLFYAKGLGKGNKCALGIKSVGIKKAEPLSSACYHCYSKYQMVSIKASSIALNLCDIKSMSLLIF